MNFNLKRPCAKCPFRKDTLKGWLGKERAKEIAEAITVGDGTFSCHNTNEFDEEGEVCETKNSEHCAGALILLEHNERPNQLMRIAERIGLYDRTKLDMKSPVFKTTKQFINHHSK